MIGFLTWGCVTFAVFAVGLCAEAAFFYFF